MIAERHIRRMLWTLGAVVGIGAISSLLWTWRLPAPEPLPVVEAEPLVECRPRGDRPQAEPAPRTTARLGSLPASTPRLSVKPTPGAPSSIQCEVVESGTELPVPGVSVGLVGETSPPGDVSDEKGIARLANIPAGTYWLRAILLHDTVTSLTLTVEEGSDAHLRITVPERETWRFRVVWTDGVGVPDMPVRLCPGSVGDNLKNLIPFVDVQGVTDSRGEVALRAFTATSDARVMTVTGDEISWNAQGPWSAYLTLGWDQIAGSAEPLNIHLKGDMVEAHGHVVGAGENLNLSANVWFDGQPPSMNGRPVSTNDNELQFEAVPGSEALLSVSMEYGDENHASVILFSRVRLPLSPGRFDFDITPTPTVDVRGVLLDAQGKPVKGAAVCLVALPWGVRQQDVLQLLGEPAGFAGVQTSEDGSFFFRASQSEQYLVVVLAVQNEALGGFRVRRLRDKEVVGKDLVLKLEPRTVIKGRVLSNAGSPIEGANVEASNWESLAGMVSHGSAKSRADGTFNLQVNRLDLGGLRVRLADMDVDFDDLLVEVGKDGGPKTKAWLRLDETGPQDIRIGGKRSIDGRVTLAGEPVPHYVLCYSDPRSILREGRLDRHLSMVFDGDGRFHLDALEGDRIDVSVTVPGSGLVGGRSLDLRGGDVDGLVIELGE